MIYGCETKILKYRYYLFTDGFSCRSLFCCALGDLLGPARQSTSVTYVLRTLSHWFGFIIMLKEASASSLGKGGATQPMAVERERRGSVRERELDIRDVPAPERPLLATRDFTSTRAFYHVRRESKRIHTPPPPRVLNTLGFPESPFLRRTLRFTRKLLPVSQQTVQCNRNERERSPPPFPPVPANTLSVVKLGAAVS